MQDWPSNKTIGYHLEKQAMTQRTRVSVSLQSRDHFAPHCAHFNNLIQGFTQGGRYGDPQPESLGTMLARRRTRGLGWRRTHSSGDPQRTPLARGNG